MTYDELSNNYWKYYKMLEEKFVESLKYVELDSENYDTYSIDFANQLNSIGSELDVFFKVVSKFKLDDRKTIADYYDEINKFYPNIKNQEIVICDKRNIKIKPFELWNGECTAQSLEWWVAYNNIKHGRVINMRDANLKNVLNILGALFILEMYLFKDIHDNLSGESKCLDVPEEGSKLFVLLNWKTRWYSGNFIYEDESIE